MIKMEFFLSNKVKKPQVPSSALSLFMSPSFTPPLLLDLLGDEDLVPCLVPYAEHAVGGDVEQVVFSVAVQIVHLKILKQATVKIRITFGFNGKAKDKRKIEDY